MKGASGGFSLFGGRQDKYEQASDLYIQAANAFRLQKQSMRLTLYLTRAIHNPPAQHTNSLICLQ